MTALNMTGSTVAFKKTENGWEAPQPGKRPQAEAEPQNEPGTAGEPIGNRPSEAEPRPLPVLDLNYKIQPDSIKSRYIVADGQYLSAENGTTVLFEGARANPLPPPKPIPKPSTICCGSGQSEGLGQHQAERHERVKQMMYVAAESQGIRTKGYAPTAADLALVGHLRQDESLNSVEGAPARTPEIDTPIEPAVQTA